LKEKYDDSNLTYACPFDKTYCQAVVFKMSLCQYEIWCGWKCTCGHPEKEKVLSVNFVKHDTTFENSWSWFQD